MAEVTPITIQVDEDALRQQVRRVIGDELKVLAGKMRGAADDLDPGFWEEQNRFVESEVQRRVKATLAKTKEVSA